MDPKKVVANNLQKLLDGKGITQTQMANRLGYPEMTVSNWIKAKTYPRVDRVQEMADYFGVRRSDITDEKIDLIKTISLSEYTYIPTAISAGLPINVEGITEYEKISLPDSVMGKWAGSQDVYILKINGDSMNNIMPDNSLIAVKPITMDGLKNGDIVLFSTNHEYSVKRFYKFDDVVVFRPDSDNLEFYETRININEIDNLEIHGKVVLYIVELD